MTVVVCRYCFEDVADSPSHDLENPCPDVYGPVIGGLPFHPLLNGGPSIVAVTTVGGREGVLGTIFGPLKGRNAKIEGP